MRYNDSWTRSNPLFKTTMHSVYNSLQIHKMKLNMIHHHYPLPSFETRSVWMSRSFYMNVGKQGTKTTQDFSNICLSVLHFLYK